MKITKRKLINLATIAISLCVILALSYNILYGDFDFKNKSGVNTNNHK
jgi:hypothetical protein